MSMIGRVVAVNVGQPRTVNWHGRAVTTAIWKHSVPGRHRLRGVNVDGDDQADRRVHGGPTKSVYAYAVEDYTWWTAVLGIDLEPGTFGDNLTVTGVDLTNCVVGERWRIGSAVLRVTEPRIPCFKLGLRMGDAGFVERFADAGRPGTYLAIDTEGELGADEPITLLHRPDHHVSISTIERAYHGNPQLTERLVDLPDLSEAWRHWAARSITRLAEATAQRAQP
jgi:MOSC domain-containing protein YiiM